MLVVRKEGKAHAQYNSFRSAFELLETVGCEPHDAFEETNDDLPPLERIELHMQQHVDTLTEGMRLLKQQNEFQRKQLDSQRKQIDALKRQNVLQQQQIDAQKEQIKKLIDENILDVEI